MHFLIHRNMKSWQRFYRDKPNGDGVIGYKKRLTQKLSLKCRQWVRCIQNIFAWFPLTDTITTIKLLQKHLAMTAQQMDELNVLYCIIEIKELNREEKKWKHVHWDARVIHLVIFFSIFFQTKWDFHHILLTIWYGGWSIDYPFIQSESF